MPEDRDARIANRMTGAMFMLLALGVVGFGLFDFAGAARAVGRAWPAIALGAGLRAAGGAGIATLGAMLFRLAVGVFRRRD